MPNKNVLIAYGIRFGSAEEISQEISKILESRGLATQLLDLKNTKKKIGFLWRRSMEYWLVLVSKSGNG
jgi:flavodoxin